MADLPTNFLDDILSASMGGKRRFKITHLNGTSEEVTIEDVSEYDQYGSKFGAGDINKTNQAVNEKFDSEDVVDPMLATKQGFAADAKFTRDAIDKINSNSHKLIDYSNETAIEAGKEFIAPSDGFVMHGVRGGDSTNENFSVKQKFTLNGNVVPPTDSVLGTCNGMWAPVKKGDVILIEKNTSVNGTVYTTYRRFYPLRQ